MPARRESPARQHSPNCRHHPVQLNGRCRPIDTPCNEALIPMLRLFNVVNPRFSTIPCVVELTQEIRHWQLARSTDQSASASMACPVCTLGVSRGLPANLSSTIIGTIMSANAGHFPVGHNSKHYIVTDRVHPVVFVGFQPESNVPPLITLPHVSIQMEDRGSEHDGGNTYV